MADSQPEQSRETRFSKALVTRMAAVGLFVALGTTAVVFMMKRPPAETAQTEGELAASSALGASELPEANPQIQTGFIETPNPSGKPQSIQSKFLKYFEPFRSAIKKGNEG
jgi:hypothetical protein